MSRGAISTKQVIALPTLLPVNSLTLLAAGGHPAWSLGSSNKRRPVFPY
jgi:hypothetical protein